MLPPVTLTPAESSTSTHQRFGSRAVAVATRLATKDLILSLLLCPPLRQVLVSSDNFMGTAAGGLAGQAQAIVCDFPFLLPSCVGSLGNTMAEASSYSRSSGGPTSCRPYRSCSASSPYRSSCDQSSNSALCPLHLGGHAFWTGRWTASWTASSDDKPASR